MERSKERVCLDQQDDVRRRTRKRVVTERKAERGDGERSGREGMTMVTLCTFLG